MALRQTDFIRDSRRRTGRLIIPLAFGLAVAACGTWPVSNPDDSIDGGIPEERREARPAEAVRLTEDVYMIPIGADTNGCMQYRMQSNARATMQAPFFRTPAGDFTTDRKLSACV